MKSLNELKKGCGKRFPICDLERIGAICGDNRFHEKDDPLTLCPLCQQQIKDREDVLEMIEELRHLWNKGNCNEREKECLNYACDRIEQKLTGEEKE